MAPNEVVEATRAERRRAFLANVNPGRDDSRWGAFDEGWALETYREGLEAPPHSDSRSRLVGDLVESYFSAYADVAASGEREAFLPLDDGLSVISRHARDLGYDAVVLFLDELILWLASHSAEPAFVSREGQKLAKLVEAEITDRPAPLISFVARQRDLKELVGEHVTGAEELSFADVLSWWEARFHKITLEDRNLPAIAARRILKPSSDEARRELDRCFEETTRVRPEVLETLLGQEGDRQQFRQLYPFSPALVQALVAISGVLQRERTALKVMLQLLVDQRDTLELGQLVPVGDLFDVIARGDEPFTEGMRIHFRNARRLWDEKLLPLLEEEHGQRWETVRARADDDPGAPGPAGSGFRNDGRLIKTLLLAALVPEVEAFKGMTPARLASLNHGTLRAPIPGREAQMVLGKLRKWAARVGQVRLSDDTVNPTVSIQLSGVDTEAIVEKARIQDNAGERMRKIREILYHELGVRSREDLFERHEISWQGHRHAFQLVFGNVRELPDESLKPSGPDWRVVLDFPFDREGHTPQDDLAHLETFRHESGAASTLIWLPSFFSRKIQKELGDLVVLDHLLTGERFDSYAGHLSAVDRQTARALLDNRRSQLREQIRPAGPGEDLRRAARCPQAPEPGKGHEADRDPGRRVDPGTGDRELGGGRSRGGARGGRQDDEPGRGPGALDRRDQVGALRRRQEAAAAPRRRGPSSGREAVRGARDRRTGDGPGSAAGRPGEESPGAPDGRPCATRHRQTEEGRP